MRAYRIFSVVLCLLLAGCETVAESENAENTAIELPAQTSAVPVSTETTVGPVHAVVTLSDEHPRLGIPIELTLRVDAEAGVSVTMPEFGDQLGKYTITNYKASDTIRDDGRYEYTQTYGLDLPRSGKHRTPSFMVEFKDARPNSSDKDKIHELLTDEISFEAASVFGDGEIPAELYPAKGELGELVIPESQKSRTWLWLLLAFAAAAGIGIGAWLKTRPKVEKSLPADVVALTALNKLKESPIPTELKAVDEWYVNLSSIVRHYLEDRFALQAPRLTTEEFFELSKRNTDLSENHRLLLRDLLNISDKVKFADFNPPPSQSQQMLNNAFQFVEETRITEETESTDNSHK